MPYNSNYRIQILQIDNHCNFIFKVRNIIDFQINGKSKCCILEHQKSNKLMPNLKLYIKIYLLFIYVGTLLIPISNTILVHVTWMKAER